MAIHTRKHVKLFVRVIAEVWVLGIDFCTSGLSKKRIRLKDSHVIVECDQS